MGRQIALLAAFAGACALVLGVAHTGPAARPVLAAERPRAAAAPSRPGLPPRAAPTSATTPPTTGVTDPGLLPQTHDLPSASSPALAARMQDLWSGIVTDDPQLAMPAFFPLTAYLQVKAVANPAADWNGRLIGAYERDIHDLHGELGSDSSAAKLVGVDVPTSQAEWIVPGVEYNKGSYYRVYGTRIRYTLDGRPGSFPVYSLISWRGEWYVVHLGPIG